MYKLHRRSSASLECGRVSRSGASGWDDGTRARILVTHIRFRAVGPIGDCCKPLLVQRPIPHRSHESHGASREAHLSTQRPSASQEARLPCSYEHPCGSRRVEIPPRQGPRPSVGLIGRIRSRDDFVRLRREGRRVRIEPFWCSHLPDPSIQGALVAFAINRAVGPAVTRNRLRRRLRAILSEMTLPPGLYLIGCRPTATELTFDQLCQTVRRLEALVGPPAET